MDIHPRALKVNPEKISSVNALLIQDKLHFANALHSFMNEISITLIEMLDLLLQKGISTFPHTITHSNIIQFNHPQ